MSAETTTHSKHVLLVCNTLYQIMVATHLRFSYFANDKVDIIISDHSSNSKKLAENARNTGVFNAVIFIENKKSVAVGSGIKFTFVRFKNRLYDTWINCKWVCKIKREHAPYDIIAITNISIFSILLYNYLRNRVSGNKNVELAIFEEGISTYSKLYAAGDKASFFHRLLNKKGIIGSTKRLFLFNKELLEWPLPHGEVVEMPKIDRSNIAYVSTLNAIFDVKDSVDIYDKKLIFMEESHFADGYSVPDVEIVEQLARKIGKENIMVKIHPRNPTNRFEALGYKTNKDTGIPWELILLNQAMDDKILVTISSGSVLYPFLSFGIPVQSYSLLNTLHPKPGFMEGDLGLMMQKVYKMYPTVFHAPSNIDDFIENLSIK